MSANQNEIDIELTPEQMAALDAAITALENLVTEFPVLSGDDKSGFVKPPEGADGWMQNMAVRAEQNLGKLSREYDPARLARDMKLDDVLEPFDIRVQRVVDRLGGARFLARSDAFAVLLGVRRQLKESGVAGVDDNLSDGLKRFFSRHGGDKAASVNPPK